MAAGSRQHRLLWAKSRKVRGCRAGSTGGWSRNSLSPWAATISPPRSLVLHLGPQPFLFLSLCSLCLSLRPLHAFCRRRQCVDLFQHFISKPQPVSPIQCSWFLCWKEKRPTILPTSAVLPQQPLLSRAEPCSTPHTEPPHASARVIPLDHTITLATRDWKCSLCPRGRCSTEPHSGISTFCP